MTGREIIFICSTEFNLKWSIAAYATSYWCGTRCDLCLTEKHIAQASQINLIKLVSANFYQTFIFSLNDSPLKTMKNVVYLIAKPLFVLVMFKFLQFFSFLSSFQIEKDKWKWNNLCHQCTCINFQKLFSEQLKNCFILHNQTWSDNI